MGPPRVLSKDQKRKNRDAARKYRRDRRDDEEYKEKERKRCRVNI